MQCNQTFNLLIGPPHHHGTIEEHTIHLIFLPTFSSDHWSISHDFICLSQARAHTPFRQANDAASPLYLGHYLFTIGKKKNKNTTSWLYPCGIHSFYKCPNLVRCSSPCDVSGQITQTNHKKESLINLNVLHYTKLQKTCYHCSSPCDVSPLYTIIMFFPC